jgi:sugar phosphate isomerase/epimerase
MQPQHLPRRDLLFQSLKWAAAASLLPSAILHAESGEANQNTNPIRLGGPSYAPEDDPEALALAHRKLGYRAAYCPNIALKDTDRIRAVADAFAKHDVALAEVGRWVNLLDASANKRKHNLQTITEGLALAEAIGARCCVTIAGSYNPDVWYGPHPDNLSPKFFDAAVENARTIIDAVKPQRAKFCYEMVGWSMPDNPDCYLKMIKAVDRPAFAVHVDACNLINSPEKFYRNTDVLNECFDKLGKWTVSCHAKDLEFVVELNVHFKEVRPGLGKLDYATYLRRVAQLPQNPPLMQEHLSNAQEYTKAREYIMATGHAAGLSFE